MKGYIRKRLAELLVSVEKGSYVRPKRLTVAQYLEQWLQGYVATNTAPRTRERYEEIVRLYLIPALGSLPLLALQPQHIQKYYAKALESGRRDGKGGLSARTVHHHHRVLYEALRHAVKHGIIMRNPAEAVDPPRPRNKEITMIGPGDVLRLLDRAKATPYSHVLPGLQEAAARRFEEGLQGVSLEPQAAEIG
jgi:site-specific recombinase XerC